MSWTVEGYNEDLHAKISTYEIFAYQRPETGTTTWKQVGKVDALPLPMACTLSQFIAGHVYYFAIRAIDQHQRIGPWSEPQSISLFNIWSYLNKRNLHVYYNTICLRPVFTLWSNTDTEWPCYIELLGRKSLKAGYYCLEVRVRYNGVTAYTYRNKYSREISNTLVDWKNRCFW